ncbi:MAG: hypothetical protein RKE49_03990 [Oceanicaulis sp.]
MHDLHHGLVLAYHGCDVAVAEALLSGGDFKKSENAYDWLGHGIYFWERDPRRGLEFAHMLAAHPLRGRHIQKPAVIGAVLTLGRCLDLTVRNAATFTSEAYQALLDLFNSHDGASMPVNSADLLRRDLDCAVFNMLHRMRAQQGSPPFDTIRGIFEEGDPAYPGAGFKDHTHIQIAVRNTDCILGVFRVPDSALD